MNIYIYDGSFDSLISLCAELIAAKTIPDNIMPEEKSHEYLFDKIHLSFNQNLYDRLNSKLNQISKKAYADICAAFLSETEGMEIKIYNYIQTVLRLSLEKNISQQKIDDYLENFADSSIRELNQLSKKVYIERHRFLGLIRFSELSDKTLYAQFEPDHNITLILAPHFKTRLPNDNWIIHDLSRGIGAVYDKEKNDYILCCLENSSEIIHSEEENAFRKIWQRYWKEIAIPERKNPKCQLNFMPKRYWKHLTETENLNR
ncbi:MAG TPA: TIGR03915 family putative DNA repair protein [Spirochaetota bacterium]|nr:TIGR03915 family putative DNA repair protein [Spirochaetota bacterium]